MDKEIKQEFGKDLIHGLSKKNKRLHSKYLYDEKGDLLFQQIMNLDEYYLTRSEFEIFSMQSDSIAEEFKADGSPFELIEFGAGDGLKTKVLLAALLKQKLDFSYIPIDISKNILKSLASDLKKEFPDLNVQIKEGTYFNSISSLDSSKRKVILFLGSNIGNFTNTEANQFVAKVSKHSNANDLFFIGVDLKKNPHVILKAYNDNHGVTKAFNLNLLQRINATFSGNIDVNSFDHYPSYDPETGEAKSYLVSLKKQDFELKDLGFTFSLKAGETIFVEVSRKYDIEEIESLATENSFVVQKHFFDCKGYFVNSLWIKK